MSAVSPVGVSPAARAGWLALAGTTAILLLASLYTIFFHAAVEEQMGIVQKIFYFHVPSAYAMYVAFVVSAFGSAMYLFKKQDKWDAWGVAGAEVGVLFCAIVLISGPLWARRAWGVWWAWDPRLTTTLLAGMIFVAYLALRSFGTAGEAERKFASGLAVVGLLDLPVIHYSVQRWRGQHPTVITAQGGGLDPSMKLALAVSFAAFTALVILLLWTRARIERSRQLARDIEIAAAQRGLMEDA